MIMLAWGVQAYFMRLANHTVSAESIFFYMTIGALLPNPTPVSDSSLANGRRHYQINCAVCHGDRGVGDGPVTKYGMPGIAIVG